MGRFFFIKKIDGKESLFGCPTKIWAYVFSILVLFFSAFSALSRFWAGKKWFLVFDVTGLIYSAIILFSLWAKNSLTYKLANCTYTFYVFMYIVFVILNIFLMITGAVQIPIISFVAIIAGLALIILAHLIFILFEDVADSQLDEGPTQPLV